MKMNFNMKKIIIDIGELDAAIRKLISREVFSEFVNIDNIIIDVFELCSGALSDGSDIVSKMCQLNTPPAITMAAIPEWVTILNKQRVTERLNESEIDIFNYDREYSIVGPDLYVALCDKQIQLDPISVFKNYLMENMDNAPFIIERLKRELGI